MSSTSEGIRARMRGTRSHRRPPSTIGSAKELLSYIVQTPLAAIAALWLICLPALYFALYGDLWQSARTLGQMTVIVLTYMLIVMAATLSIAFAISYAMWLRERRRWSRQPPRKR